MCPRKEVKSSRKGKGDKFERRNGEGNVAERQSLCNASPRVVNTNATEAKSLLTYGTPLRHVIFGSDCSLSGIEIIDVAEQR